MTVIKGISGIRGIVNQGFDSHLVTAYALVFSELQNSGKLLIARDARPHGEKFLTDIANILSANSRAFHNYDIIPTPTAQFLIHHENYCGGIVITASHNPIKWNGMKFIDSDGCFLSANKIYQLNQMFEKLDSKLESKKNIYKNKPFNKPFDGINKHISHTSNLSIINKNRIRAKKYNVAIDAVNGAASIALPLLLKLLGCNVFEINCVPNGIPSRGMEPIKENLNDICVFIKENNIDIGFATDPDGDRLSVIDSNGKPLGEELTLPICVTSLLNGTLSNTTIITNLSTSMMLDQICNKNNITLKRSAVGEINVVEEMKKNNSIIGGEGNGGVILTESHYGRDSLVACAMILNYMASCNESIEDIYIKIPNNFLIKSKLSINNTTFQQIKLKLLKAYNNVVINELDGIKLEWDSKWVHIRPSNTEPIIRLFVESTTKTGAEQLMNEIIDCLNEENK